MLGEPAVPRMDPGTELGVPAWDNAWDGLGGVLDGRPMGCGVMLWDEGALPGGGGAAAAAAAGDAMTTCALGGGGEACTLLPWEGEPEGNGVHSCLPGGLGVGGAGAERGSFLLGGGGGGETEESVSAALFWPIWLLLPPLPDPEGLPVEEEELESLSMLLGIPDMRSQNLMGPAQREGGGGGVD